MKRLLGAVVALVVVVGLGVAGVAWARSHSCRSASFTVDAAPGSGSETADQAIDVFLAGFSTFELPHDAWTQQDASHYSSGSSVVEMLRLSDGGYVVTGARTC
jgi:hypothetical protein